MPECNGKNGCKYGHTHQYSVSELLKGMKDSDIAALAARKKPSVAAPCGGRCVFGRHALRQLRQKAIPVSASTPMTIDRLQKAFDDLFLSRMPLKAPGTYLYQGGRPVAFISYDDVTGKIISREIFSDMNKETADRVTLFIKKKIPDAQILDEAGQNIGVGNSSESEKRT